MDTTAIAMRLRKLDSYLRTLRQMQAVPLDEYLNDDNIQTIVHRNLTEELEDFDQFSQEIISQFLSPDSSHME